MIRKTQKIFILCVLSVLIFFTVITIVYYWVDIPYDVFYTYAQEHRIIGAILFGFIMFISTVIAPITVFPMVPIMAPILGPFTTGLATYIGWVTGAAVAFLVSRTYGQNFVFKFVPEKEIKKISMQFNGGAGFTTIVMFRILFPADVLSYALGLFTTISFRLYMSATMLGTLWSSFMFSYIGDFIVRGDYVLLSGMGVASVALLYFSGRYIRAQGIHKKEKIK